jgi:gliding motility-associated-like protein
MDICSINPVLIKQLNCNFKQIKKAFFHKGYINFVLMKKVYLQILLLLFISRVSYCTHNRAGEITYRQVSALTYEFTVTTFTYTLSPANRSELTVDWGDNTSSIAPLTNRTTLPGYYYHNTYVAQHTFPGPGTYVVMMQDPNRNFGVLNIPNSVNTVFSIETTLIISPWVGYNNTPELLNFPIDKAALHHVFIHNPAAFDIDGDSISYKLTTCTGEDGKPIQGYTLPAYSDSLTLNPVTGDLIWASPVDTGIYNIAMNIEEWRNKIKIGNIVRDMQIQVVNTDDNPPVNPPLNNYCVEAGDTVEFAVTSTDPDGDPVVQSMVGGPFQIGPDTATFVTDSSGYGFVTSTFRWITSCENVRKQPYYFVLKSEDVNNDVQLVDISNFYIRVLGKPPENLQANPASNEITLTWDTKSCGDADGYKIYRREGPSGFIPDSCENGVPEYTGYKLIDKVSGINNTTYTDNNAGEGLSQGIEYCYIITYDYPDGGEGFASNEACATLVPGLPAILNTSVTKVDATNGEIYLSWIKPRGIDTTKAPGPYVYRILRKQNADNNFSLLDSIVTTDLNDTVYYDTPLNTVQFPYYYSIELYNITPGNRFLIGTPEIASSLYLDIVPADNQLTLNFRKKVPWLNTEYIVYKLNETTQNFDSIGVTTKNNFIDDHLANGTKYTYKAKSIGWRPVDSLIFNNQNLSHIASGIPIDTVAPCPPILFVESHCDSMYNQLNWTNPNHSCANDVVKYNIYYSPTIADNLPLLDSIKSPNDTSYIHRPVETLAGCYYVTAVDSFGNESLPSGKQCIDNCLFYDLPNVFSPNGDNVNDIYVAMNLNNYVKKVNMKIYSRWGQLVFQTEDPLINWDGKDMKTKKLVSPGVYYYVCDVYEPRITGVEVRNIVGFIHVYTGKTTPRLN